MDIHIVKAVHSNSGTSEILSVCDGRFKLLHSLKDLIRFREAEGRAAESDTRTGKDLYDSLIESRSAPWDSGKHLTLEIHSLNKLTDYWKEL